MLQSQADKSPLVRERRFDRAREVSNGLYIFEYSPDKGNSKKSNEINVGGKKHQKSAAYFLKMEELKEKRKQLDGSVATSGHKSNIQRLRSLIKNGRSHTKAQDSGIEKMMRALQKIMKTSTNIRTAFDSVRRQSMTASSNNMELFIQSRHPNLNDTIKIGNGGKGRQDKLMSINQHSDQTAMNVDSFNYFKQISKHLAFPNEQKDKQKDNKQNSFSFRSFEIPKDQKYTSKGYLTTQEDLSLQVQKCPQKYQFQTQKYQKKTQGYSRDLIRNQIKLNMPKKGFYGGLIQAPLKSETFSNQKNLLIVKNLEPEMQFHEIQDISNAGGSDEVQLLFSQIAFIFIKKNDQQIEKKTSKPSSPIYNLFAFPTMNNSAAEYNPSKFNESQLQSQKGISSVRKSSNVFRKSRREELANNKQYANRMLFGQLQIKAQQKRQPVRNPLMQEQNLRQRIRSLPKITFTYTSREKYERECSPEMKNSIFPINIYKKREERERKSDNSHKNSKEQLQTTISSKRTTTRVNPRFGTVVLQQNKDYNMGGVKVPMRHQKIVVSPRQKEQYSMASSYTSAVPQRMSNEYYGTYANLRRFDQERERVITANPDMNTGVQFVGAERDAPSCCIVKEVRSKSMNDRVVLFNYQNQPHY